MKTLRMSLLFVFLLSMPVVPPTSFLSDFVYAADRPFLFEAGPCVQGSTAAEGSRCSAAVPPVSRGNLKSDAAPAASCENLKSETVPAVEAGLDKGAARRSKADNSRRYYFSRMMCRTYPKLDRANADIKGLEDSIRAIAPGISRISNWDDRITGFSGLIIGKPINDRWDYNLVMTFARGSIDTTTAARVQTAIPSFVPLNGATLNAYFRQEYCTKTIGFGGRYNMRSGKNNIALAAYMDYIDFNSYTDYTLRAPGFSRIASGHFHKRKFFPVFSANFERQVRKNTSLILFFEYIPSCMLRGEAYGDDVVNGVYSRAAIPVEIDLSTRKPNVGLMVCSRF